MPNQTRQPFGDIFSVQTPYLDQLSNRIYTDQKQKELYKQQQDKALDDEFSRNLTGIRDADIGKLTQAYGDFKQARMATLNKNVPPEQQLDVLRKKAAIYDVIDKSKTQREHETGLGKQIMTDKKGIFADDAHNTLTKIMQTPVDEINPNDEQKLLYPYSVPKLDKQLKDARGTEQEVPIKLGQSKTDPLKDDVEIYKAGNAPDKFANKLLEGVLSTNETRNFSGLYNNKYDEGQLEDLKNRYTAKVNDPKFISVYGEPKPLPAMDTDLGKAVAIRTMEEFANMDLKPSKLTSQINDARATANRQQFAQEQQARGDFFARRRQQIGESLRETYKDYSNATDSGEQEGILNKFNNESYNAGSNKVDGANIDHLTIDGKNYTGKFVDVPTALKYEYAIPSGKKDDNGKDTPEFPKFYMTDDKKTVIPVFLGSSTGTNKNAYIKPESKPIPIHVFNTSLAKVLLTKKQTGEEVTNDDLTNDVLPNTHTTETHSTHTKTKKTAKDYGL